MARYRIVFKQSVAKDFRQIPKKDIQGILRRINDLTDDPRLAGVEKLTEDEKFRVRQGNYRILYAIDDNIITVTLVKVEHRRDVYR